MVITKEVVEELLPMIAKKISCCSSEIELVSFQEERLDGLDTVLVKVTCSDCGLTYTGRININDNAAVPVN